MAVRVCPKCGSERPVVELLCRGLFNGSRCNWDLSGVPLTQAGMRRDASVQGDLVPPVMLCPNGHAYDEGDLLCPECGASIEEQTRVPDLLSVPDSVRLPSEWVLDQVLTSNGDVRERYLVHHTDDDHQGVLTLYREGSEPDSDVQHVLQRMDVDHIPKLLEHGRFEKRSYEVFEHITGGNLDDLEIDASDKETLHKVVDEIGRALDDFAQVGLRHRDLRPHTILIRSADDLDLVIDGFGSARLSDFDLDIESPLEITRYMAPEAIAGGVAAASDWWSLGMMLLEKVTAGACFEGVHEQAFLIHVFANGVPIPDDLDPDIRLLLRGLLARAREARWQWSEVKAWLEGEPVSAPDEYYQEHIETGPPFYLGGKAFHDVKKYALAAAEQINWDEGCEQLVHGQLLNWLEETQLDPRGMSMLRSLSSSELETDDQFSIGLKVLNPDMPLIRRGKIVSPAWLIQNPLEGYRLISGVAPDLLDDLNAEPWLSQLKRREKRVRDVARYHEVDLNEELLQVLLVATSVAQLKVQWDTKRQICPDTDHHGLASIADRHQVSEEDLIILCAAEYGQFRTIDEIVEEAEKLAREHDVKSFDTNLARELLQKTTKRDLLKEVEVRIHDFASCSSDSLDKWADQLRVEHRLSLPKAAVLLSIPQDQWIKPPRHAYVKQLITYFEQKLALSIRQGPLSRMSIAKTSAKIDLVELGTNTQPAEAMLNRLLTRSEFLTNLDPQPFIEDPILERRIRNLERHASLYKRDTGIDGLYMGFPFLLLQLPNRNTKPRIAPVLLWPIKLIAEVGRQGLIRLAFDTEREEVRLNPALESYVGPESFERWKDVSKSILGRSITARDVVDEFGRLAAPRQRSLTKLPGLGVKVNPGFGELACSAVLFHVKFMGQAIVEDLRQLKGQRIEGSALEAMLRLSRAVNHNQDNQTIVEADRFITVDSDPSQEKAILDARVAPGIVISGPPGTGKSQTIVNIVADAIGKQRSMLIVCQKQPALEVVQKRLEAEGLGDRVMMVTDENKDRKAVVKQVREQVEVLLRAGIQPRALEQERSELAARVESLEGELDTHHRGLHRVNDECGLSYRDLIAELVNLEDSTYPVIDCLAIRSIVASIPRERVVGVIEKCATLVNIWLESKYEGSPLNVLEEFGWDDATVITFRKEFAEFLEADEDRVSLQNKHKAAFKLKDSERCRNWYNLYKGLLDGITPQEKTDLGRWIHLFKGDDTRESKADTVSGELRESQQQLAMQVDHIHNHRMYQLALSLDGRELRNKIKNSEKAIKPVRVFGRLNPIRAIKRWVLKRLLDENDLPSNEDGLKTFLECLRLESVLRPHRAKLEDVQHILGDESELTRELQLGPLLASVSGCISEIDHVRPIAEAMLVCPKKAEAIQASESPKTDSINEFLINLDAACEQADARARSLRSLRSLSSWFEKEWIVKQEEVIEKDLEDLASITCIDRALPTVANYQKFRVRSKSLSNEEWELFAALRGVEDSLGKISPELLNTEVRRIIQREQRLAWKADMERQNPGLLSDRSEIEAKVRSLVSADQQMRVLNRKLLAKGINISQLADKQRWGDITRLSGIRMKRLREFIRLGMELGLTSLRPVWLMNPETVSRILPLTRGLFDVVVFDEASQMLVEHALPTLYRGSLVVVSGDEKQLPPTSFFSSKVESDEAEILDGDMPDEDATEEEIEALEEVWDKREIKNCPDLLALGTSALPNTLLEIHYRSIYRELIAFSNAAFYAGRLNVPARHPNELIRSVRPIEVIRVDGVYEHQVNKDEATEVAHVAERFWSVPREERPTIGVVTFNRKQADLILETMQEYAEENPSFRKAYAEENERYIDGEDVRFFVKNVESVQGDERDIMIFSTTFGRNSQGAFRRTFGVLGQKGGERRLNVAVTRAKGKVVLVTSMPVDEVSDFLTSRRHSSMPRDYLQAYLYYAERLSEGDLDVAKSLLSRLNSSYRVEATRQNSRRDGFAETVADFIRKELRLDPIEANDGTAFGIDYAIENLKTGLFGIGIECDSPKHSLLRRARAREIWRRKVLQQSIPVIHRVSSYGWYHKRELEKQMLSSAINSALT